MREIGSEIVYGLRALKKSPGFTLLVLLVLALGIGANTTMFSVVEAVLLRPLPYEQSDRLVWMSETGDEVANRWVSYPNFLDWQDHNRVFEAVSTFRRWTITLTGGGEAESVDATMVSADYFRIMRVRPLLGRDFDYEDDRPGANPVAILSYDFWRQRFGGDPEIVGRKIILDDRPYVVVGVMPGNFVHRGSAPLWLLIGPQNWTHRDVRTAGNVIGRLRPGVTLAQARADMNAISAELARLYPRENAGGHHVQITSLRESVSGSVRPALLVLLGAVGIVLLIVCANVANLILARAATKQRELAVRMALGATRWRIVRHLLVESLLLAVVGGTLGLLAACWGIAILSAAAQSVLPQGASLEINASILMFNLVLSLLTGVAFGIAPAWRVSGVEPNTMLKEGSRATADRHNSRLRSLLVVSEIALSMALLVGAGLLVKSMQRLVDSDRGFDTRGVVTMDLKASRQRYGERAALARLSARIIERVSELPGVESACLSNNLPGITTGWQNDILPEGYPPLKPGEMINVDWAIVSADYFRTMGVSILEGRSFTQQEVEEGRPVLLVDERLARRFWPEGDAVGKHLKYDSPVWHEIIGVVRPVSVYGSEATPLIKIYTPLGRAPQTSISLSVRTGLTDPLGIAGSITDEVHAIDHDVAVSRVAMVDDLLARNVSTKKFNAILFGLFAALALILAAAGVYGVMSYAVSQRTQEIGVRMALGAQSRDVIRLFLAHGSKLICGGIAAGLLGALVLSRIMASLLFGVTPTDPPTFAAVAAVLIFTAGAACYLPARRATQVDPVVALRSE